MNRGRNITRDRNITKAINNQRHNQMILLEVDTKSEAKPEDTTRCINRPKTEPEPEVTTKGRDETTGYY